MFCTENKQKNRRKIAYFKSLNIQFRSNIVMARAQVEFDHNREKGTNYILKSVTKSIYH